MGTPATATLFAPPAQAPAPAVRILLVDRDHARRQLMRYVAELGSTDLAVVGTAENLDSAVNAAERLDPTAVLLEIQLPVDVGLATIAALHAADASRRIVVCSFHKDKATQAAALAAGASCYLVKPISPRDLFAALNPG